MLRSRRLDIEPAVRGRNIDEDLRRRVLREEAPVDLSAKSSDEIVLRPSDRLLARSLIRDGWSWIEPEARL
jgi:hypothetical protein